jgi:gamma-glutamylcyclotransferase (GGCT)/AIG2-like uncharacterized protein YtfP
MKEITRQLFVYGSLRSGFHNPAYFYITKHFRLLGEAVVQGKLFDNGEYPVAVPDTGDSFINGELYELNNPAEFTWVIGQLDDYEGVNAEDGESPGYKREPATVYQEGKPTIAWIYWYNKSVKNMPPIETGDVLKYMQQKNKPGNANNELL